MSVGCPDAEAAKLLTEMCVDGHFAGNAYVVEPGETAVLHFGEIEPSDGYRVVLTTSTGSAAALRARLGGHYTEISTTPIRPTIEAYARWLAVVTRQH